MKKIYFYIILHFFNVISCFADFDYKNQDDKFWETHLDGETLRVCRFKATEKPESGQYDKLYKKGTYYCACCGGDYALFSSDTKFDSGTGWPSFYQPLINAIIEQPDPDDKIRDLFGLARIEVTCARCGSHLGHVFDDGPPPTGKRYCMNSAALNFTPEGEQPTRTFDVDNANSTATGEESTRTNPNKKNEEAIFAMGCFWSAESEFQNPINNDKIKGIISLKVGYAGGTKPNPTYQDHAGYKEAVKITYDPAIISYNKLLKIFWHNIDPFDAKGQFCDKGSSYTAAVFFTNEIQKTIAEVEKHNLQKILHKKIVTEIIPYTNFYNAEEYHQNYKNKNPIRYRYYRWHCGHDKRLEKIWGRK